VIKNVNRILFKDYTFIQEKELKQRREKVKGLLHAVNAEMEAHFEYLTAQASANALRAEWKKKHNYLHTLFLEEQQK